VVLEGVDCTYTTATDRLSSLPLLLTPAACTGSGGKRNNHAERDSNGRIGSSSQPLMFRDIDDYASRRTTNSIIHSSAISNHLSSHDIGNSATAASWTTLFTLPLDLLWSHHCCTSRSPPTALPGCTHFEYRSGYDITSRTHGSIFEWSALAGKLIVIVPKTLVASSPGSSLNLHVPTLSVTYSLLF